MMIGEEVITHLQHLEGAEVTVSIEIHATVPDGIPDKVVQTVSENCKTLKFGAAGFEAT